MGWEEWIGNVRVAQSKSARFRTSVAQHCAVVPEQTTAWRSSSSTGAERAMVAKKEVMMVVKSMVMVMRLLVWFGWLVGWFGGK